MIGTPPPPLLCHPLSGQGIRKDHYRQHVVRDEEILFSDITDVDCIAISFFLDTLSALDEEESSTRQQTLPSEQPLCHRQGIGNR